MNIKPILKGTAILTVSSTVTLVGSVMLLPIFARLMTPDMFGMLGLLTPFTTMIATVFCLGFTAAEARDLVILGEEKGEMGSYLFTTNLFLLMMSFVGLILLLFPSLGSMIVGIFGLKNIPFHYIVLAYVSGVLINFSVMLNIYYNFKQKYAKRAIVTFVGFIINSAVSLSIIFALKDGVLGELVGGISAAILILVVLGNEYFQNFRLDFQVKYLNSALHIGIPITIAGIFGALSQDGNRFIMNIFLPLGIIGQYSIAWTLASTINIVFSSFHVAWMPIFFDNLRQGKPNQEIEPYLISALIITAACILAAQVFVKDLALLLLSKRYLDAATMSVSLLPYFLGTAMSILLSDYLIYFKITYWGAIINIVLGILGLVVTYLLVPIFGVSASIQILVATQIMSSIVYFAVLYFRFGLRFRYWVFALLIGLVANPLTIQIGERSINNAQDLVIKIAYFIVVLALLIWLLPMKTRWIEKLRQIALDFYSKRRIDHI